MLHIIATISIKVLFDKFIHVGALRWNRNVKDSAQRVNPDISLLVWLSYLFQFDDIVATVFVVQI